MYVADLGCFVTLPLLLCGWLVVRAAVRGEGNEVNPTACPESFCEGREGERPSALVVNVGSKAASGKRTQ